MANYLLLYHGGGMPETPEENAKVMEAWGGWMGKLGDKLVDGGNPTTQSKRIDGGGNVSASSGEAVTGYSVIKADSLDEAVELSKGCPIFLGPRPATIDVYETFEAM